MSRAFRVLLRVAACLLFAAGMLWLAGSFSLFGLPLKIALIGLFVLADIATIVLIHKKLRRT